MMWPLALGRGPPGATVTHDEAGRLGGLGQLVWVLKVRSGQVRVSQFPSHCRRPLPPAGRPWYEPGLHYCALAGRVSATEVPLRLPLADAAEARPW